MARDHNTFAKRQREMDRKRKADEKRLHRRKKKTEPSTPSGADRVSAPEQRPEPPDDSSSMLSSNQTTLLATFRHFRMSAGQMLCFSRPDLEAFRTSLTELADNGLLVKERFPGGYSLTPTGFAAMQAMP